MQDSSILDMQLDAGTSWRHRASVPPMDEGRLGSLDSDDELDDADMAWTKTRSIACTSQLQAQDRDPVCARAPLGLPPGSCASANKFLQPSSEAASRPSSQLLRRRAIGVMPKLQMPGALSDGGPGRGSDACTGHGCHAGVWDRSVNKSYSHFDKIGGGSTSIVYRAVRRIDDRPVVLKVMRNVDPESASVVQREYEILKSIKHPNIIEAVDFVQSVACLALVLEAFDGRTLREAVRGLPERGLPSPGALRLALQLLRAVGHLHGLGIVHRDVKAENVLVSADLERLKLTDFNTARSILEGHAISPTGTYAYIAPEVQQGEPFSAQADVWAVGLCLHFMLHGRLPARSAASGDTGSSPSAVSCCEDTAAGTSASAGPGSATNAASTPGCPTAVSPSGGDGPCVHVRLCAAAHSCLAEDPALRPSALELLEELLPVDEVLRSSG